MSAATFGADTSANRTPSRRDREDRLDVAVHEEEVGIGAGEHDHHDGRVVVARVEQADQPADEGSVDQVRGWMVDRHRCHSAVNENAERAVYMVHPPSPRAAAANASNSRAMSGPAGV